MIHSTYILALSHPSYAKRQLWPMLWGKACQRLPQKFDGQFGTVVI